MSHVRHKSKLMEEFAMLPVAHDVVVFHSCHLETDVTTNHMQLEDSARDDVSFLFGRR
jgi:hypothetical protein